MQTNNIASLLPWLLHKFSCMHCNTDNGQYVKKRIFILLEKVLESLKPRVQSYHQKLYFGAWLTRFCPYSTQWELPGTLKACWQCSSWRPSSCHSYIQRADVATAPWLRPAQCLHLSYHPCPFSSLHRCLFPMPPSVFCEGDSLWLQQNCRLFRAIVLSKCDFWDMEKPGISWSLIPVLSLHGSPALLRDLRALDTEKPTLERSISMMCFAWGGNLLSLHKNMVQDTLKLNFNSLLCIFKCMLHDKPPCD